MTVFIDLITIKSLFLRRSHQEIDVGSIKLFDILKSILNIITKNLVCFNIAYMIKYIY